jgi:tRNA(fMet)-specific endonuclease VapC
MPGELLLDTNIVIALFAGEQRVKDRLAAAAGVFVPAVAMGELYYGAEKSGRAVENIERVREFAESTAVLPCDSATAREYGRIKLALRVRGRPIPENDIWIAAVAIQHEITLLSRDDHFGEVAGLSWDRGT